MTVAIEVEDEAWAALPGLEDLARMSVAAALAGAGNDATNTEIALLFTDDQAMTAINAEWRGIEKPTNVLSFPSPEDLPVIAGEPRQLGDIVLASGVVAREAVEQGKALRDHTAHLIVHGVLHLLGHDHEDETEARDMEGLEIDILKGLGVSNPYERE